ncbi:MAG: mechanosensitive ion channel [Candidatus Omnitrophica bacterium]|nr:mechanosensitive ion channel [Candidatus Omnitrophota bacterium]MCB9720477.1 mechanosensitive ion channel [Candidatus Omnitrophota bacterium]
MNKTILRGLILGAFVATIFFANLAASQDASQTGEAVQSTTAAAAETAEAAAKKPLFNLDKTAPPQSLEEMATDQVETVKKLATLLIEFFVKYSFQVLGGIIVLVLGWCIGGFISRRLLLFFQGKKFDVTVSKFIAQCVKLMVMVFAVIVAMGKFGIEIAPLIAGLSVAGFGLSFALQGPLSNYAAGVSLIFTKPFKVGDIVEVAGRTGEVLEIKLPRTELRTVDGVLIMIPNNDIVGEIIHNCSEFKRVDIEVGVAYSSDVDKAIQIIRDIIKADQRINQGAKAQIGIQGFGDSSVDLQARVWCAQDQYYQVLYEVNKKIFDAFNQNGIVIPFPQRDVHVIKNEV